MLERIPQILHQAHLSPENKVNLAKLNFLKFHPDWEYKLWTEDDVFDLIQSKYPDFFLTWFYLYPQIKKWQAAIPAIMHHYGGVYADINTQFRRNIDPLIPKWHKLVLRSLASNEQDLGGMTNSFFASVKGSPIWLRQMNYIKNYDVSAGRKNSSGEPANDILDLSEHAGEICLGNCLQESLSLGEIKKDEIYLIRPNFVGSSSGENINSPGTGANFIFIEQ